MGEAKVTRKTSFFKSLRGEYKKIVWPNLPTLMKQTWTVIVISILVGIIISLIDMGYLFIIRNLLGIG